MNRKKSIYDDIYAVVQRIPHGRVATYGQIAILAGAPRHARVVGYALNAMPEESKLPWHRVINARGQVSGRSEPGWVNYQRKLLEAEGVLFSPAGVVSLKQYQWRPRTGTGGADRPGSRGAGGSGSGVVATRHPLRRARTRSSGRQGRRKN